MPAAPAALSVSDDAFRPHSHRAVALWLLLVAGMVLIMVVIGGMTRLTESGLSITEWQPIAGTLPPLSEADWQALFAKYRQSPQFMKMFPNLDLAGFKEIFWLEYIHRLWGRLIGVAFALPLVWFWLRRRIPKGYGPALLGLLVLGGLQGAVGWIMVASGLVDRPSVSHYRLALHLVLAIFIYVALVWTALGLLQPRERGGPVPLRKAIFATGLLIGATIVVGAFVAGLRAGLIYNTFPLMGGSLVPSDYWHAPLGWLNPFENPAAVQFHHRVLATITLAGAAWLWWRARTVDAPARVRTAAALLLVAVIGQYGLGIGTLLVFGASPPPMAEAVAIGTTHQGWAMIVVTAVVWLAHAARRRS